MIRIEFTDQQKEQLNYQRYHHPHPRVQQKMEALWLKSQGLSHQDIAKLTAISTNTLRSYLNDYVTGGIEKLKRLNFYRPQSQLHSHVAGIETYFRKHPPATVREAMHEIELLTSIKRSPTAVRTFLKSLGLKCRKVGMVPSKADGDKQREFVKKNSTPVLNRQVLVKAPFSSLMRPTLFWLPSSDSSGRLPDCLSKRRLGASASRCP